MIGQRDGQALSPSRHVALVKLTSLQTLDDSIIEGLSRTISQLSRLGLRCVIVIDPQDYSKSDSMKQLGSRKAALEQADRLVSALERIVSTKANRLDDILGIVPLNQTHAPTVSIKGAVEVQYPRLLSRSLARGVVPIVSPIAFSQDSQRIIDVGADKVMLAITRELAGVRSKIVTSTRIDTPEDSEARRAKHEDFYILDKIIILDPVGPIPSVKRSDGRHVFLNLEQEYEGERRELLQRITSRGPSDDNFDMQRHLENLDLIRNTLSLLPPSSSALLTTARQAATPARQEGWDAIGVQTRRPKNPLIFTLLTDKPLISSSLPAARMTKQFSIPASDEEIVPLSLCATFVKRGMPLTVIPDPDLQVWAPPRPNEHRMSLEDSRIDFPRLLDLIEDSFNRPLDVKHYIDRIRNKIAGIIVAGEYEGGAILTWELPPGVPDNGSESTRQRMVPYLDKFAVLKRSQGGGGVADIVFSAMVGSCFPDGVCWRSRRDNPVNKWYFERSVGTWKMPASNWTMFWTDRNLEQGSRRWLDYESVCRTVAPSWADNRHVVD